MTLLHFFATFLMAYNTGFHKPILTASCAFSCRGLFNRGEMETITEQKVQGFSLEPPSVAYIEFTDSSD